MQNGVTFWTEGGASIGMGHVMRCISIAHALDSDEFALNFLVNSERPVIERLDSEAFFHITYPMTGRHAGRLAGSVVVIDTKRDVSDHVHALKAEGKRVVLIDNTTSAEADAVVMPNPIYQGSGGGGGKLVAGSDYIIIGESFKRARGACLAHSMPLKVLVTMGGADPFGLTDMVLKAIAGVRGLEVTVVTGPAFKSPKALEEAYGMRGFTFAHSPRELAPLMMGAHVAFTAVGTTVYELAYMGVPSMIIGNYESDRADLEALHGLGVCRSLGFYRDVDAPCIREAVEYFRDAPGAWQQISERARSLADGEGASRIAGLIRSLIGARMAEGGDR